MSIEERLSFIIGEEKELRDILTGEEILPLLERALKVGPLAARLLDQIGTVLWGVGHVETEKVLSVNCPLYLEGEKTGQIVLFGHENRQSELLIIAEFIAGTVNAMIVNNLKRMLTTEIHTTIVNQSYEELAASEAKYRDLAEKLEVKVEQRTSDLKQAHTILLQQEKMAAIGQLAAGVAHEINNPLGFIASNLNSLKKYSERFIEMIALYRQTIGKLSLPRETAVEFDDTWRKLKMDFIIADTEELLIQSLDGCKRVTKIVADLKAFSHIDDGGIVVIDINTELERILNVLSHWIPADAVIQKKFADLPGYPCDAAAVSQVFLNIIQNAIQTRESGLQLDLETIHDRNKIKVIISDNGPGMAPEVVKRIFDPFFTTREVGKGTGMGLATAYETMQSLGGRIEVDSKPGCGSIFIITFPVSEAVNV
ncbi:MAG: histidine kinase [Proteobacteria bacterium]|nr:histidine kinase [Pseudomonadota bacterium]MBU1686917.1 histidine kinase [Pseudomonadota bacterium]